MTGGELFAAATESLARSGLGSALNPGHLTGHEEWHHSPVRPGSGEKLRSGMPFQLDMIPTPVREGWALNCEDPIAFGDLDLRNGLKAKYPDVAARIEARRAFMRDRLGVVLSDDILPLSNTPLCLPPFWLAAGRLLVAD